MSSAPEPPSSVRHTKSGIADEDVPDHLYEDLPEHFLQTDEKGRKVPDYLRMILMCMSDLFMADRIQACTGLRCERSRQALAELEPYQSRLSS
jgi:hypothetical protein